MSIKRGLLVVLVASGVMLAVGGGPWLSGSAQTVQSVTTEWVLQGRVYEGEVGDESMPLQDVTVFLYGSNNPYPDTGTFLRSTTANAEGWYGLTVYDDDDYEYFHIRETDPAGYISIGAMTVSGTVRADNWIEYAIPLEEKTLTGNKFWLVPTSSLDLQIAHVELTQAIQCKDNSHCTDNSVPLIVGKDTYVRVYVKIVNASSVSNVSAAVAAYLPTGDVSGVPLYMPITAKANPQQSQATDTLNFLLPASSVSSSGTLAVMVNPHYTVAESNYANNTITMSLNLVSTPRLDIVPVRIYYNYGGTSGVVNPGMPYCLSNYLENILPVGEIKWHVLPGPPLEWKQQIGPGEGSWGQILAKLRDMRNKNTWCRQERIGML